VADEVVLAVKQVQPVPWLEVHGHGGCQALRFLLEEFTARGMTPCAWQEFVYLTDDDGLRARAAAALALAPTPRTAAILLGQYHGALGAALDAILTELDAGRIEEATRQLAELAGRALLGRHLTAPRRVTVAGAPNVGKSSLVNALAGFQRSVVAPHAGHHSRSRHNDHCRGRLADRADRHGRGASRSGNG
jgi:tRNA modification GTPase